jgi:hypothetical protein
MSWAEALIGALGGGAKSMGDQLKSEQELEERRALMKEQADLDLVKMQKAEQLKRQAATQARTEMTQAIDQRMGGLVDGAITPAARKQVAPQFAAARPANAATWTPAQQAAVDQARGLAEQEAAKDPALRDKLMQDPGLKARAAADAGYIPEAKTLQDMDKDRFTQVGYGAMLVDKEGNIRVDNSQGRQAERLAALEKKGAPKPFDMPQQAALAKNVDDALKGVGAAQETLPAVFAPMGTDGKPVEDKAFNNSFRKLVGKAAEQAYLQGDSTSLNTIINAAQSKLQPIRDSAMNEAIRAREGLFGADGKSKVTPDVAEKMRSMYGAQVPLSSPEEFGQFVYGWNLNRKVNSLLSPRSDAAPSTPKTAPAPAPNPAKEAPRTPEKEETKGAKAQESKGGKVIRPLIENVLSGRAFDGPRRGGGNPKDAKRLWDEEAAKRNES